MGYLLDTCIAIEIGNGNEEVVACFSGNAATSFLSALCLAELQRGLASNPALLPVREERLDVLLRTIPVLAFDQTAAEAYGRIIAQVGWARGRDFDRMIAAHAIATSNILVTNNEADFRDIPGLRIVNWT